MALGIEEIQRRLAAMSEHDGKPFGRAHLLFDAEQEHVDASVRFYGYQHLSDAFKCFFLETVELINTESRPKIKEPLSEFYALFIPHIVNCFATVCGAERVAIMGYPHQGYTLLRNVFDTAVLCSAALQKMTDFYSIYGVIPGVDFEPKASKKLRLNTERQVREYMTGPNSKLTPETIAELDKLNDMFDWETHGGKLSHTMAKGWMQGKDVLPILPKFDQMSFALFMNRFAEAGWMLHRLVPAMQLPVAPLPDGWREKWQILDASFEQMVDSITKELGKPVGAAVVEFVKAKFPFDSKAVFPL